MLFANPAGRDDAPGREREGLAEDRLGHEYALGMVPQGPVPKIGGDLLALVDYLDTCDFTSKAEAFTFFRGPIMQVTRTPEGTVPRYFVRDDAGNSIEPIHDFLRYLDARGSSPNTIRSYAYDLRRVWEFFEARGLEWQGFNISNAVDLIAYLHDRIDMRPGRSATAAGPDRLSPATVNRALAAMSSFCDWAIIAGTLTPPNPMRVSKSINKPAVTDRHRPFFEGISRRSASVRVIRVRSVHRLPRPLSDDQIERLLAELTNLRDRALVLLMLHGGLRPGEALSLHLEDIAYGRRRVTVRCRADHPKGARGKSRVERVVDLHDGQALDTISAYVMLDRPRETETPFIFLVGGNGTRRSEPLSYAALAKAFARAAERAGIKSPGVTPHALRHTHATRMWEAGMRELTLQRRLGHASPESTRIYTRVSDATVLAEYSRAMGLKP
jgi:integrase